MGFLGSYCASKGIGSEIERKPPAVRWFEP